MLPNMAKSVAAFALVALLCVVGAAGVRRHLSDNERRLKECEDERKKFAEKGRFRLIHRRTECSPWALNHHSGDAGDDDDDLENLLQEAAERDAQRYLWIDSRCSGGGRGGAYPPEANSTITPATGVIDFAVEIAFGSPQKFFYLAMDTGSDLTWLPCAGCSGCNVSSVFDKSQSFTVATQTCNSLACTALSDTGNQADCDTASNVCLFNTSYADMAYRAGELLTDRIAFGLGYLPHFPFGCAKTASGHAKETGLLGLSQGAFSLVSLTVAADSFDGVFGYCFPRYSSRDAGYMVLGKWLVDIPLLDYTALIAKPVSDYFYYVDLVGIAVDNVRVDIPAGTFDLDTTTRKGGVIVDSGTTFTVLTSAAYQPVAAAFAAAATGVTPAQHPNGTFGTCFAVPTDGSPYRFPSVTLQLSGLNLQLSRWQTLKSLRSNHSVKCLAFTSTTGERSIWGNFQQAGLFLLYDIPNAKLGIGPC